MPDDEARARRPSRGRYRGLAWPYVAERLIEHLE